MSNHFICAYTIVNSVWLHTDIFELTVISIRWMDDFKIQRRKFDGRKLTKSWPRNILTRQANSFLIILFSFLLVGKQRGKNGAIDGSENSQTIRLYEFKSDSRPVLSSITSILYGLHCFICFSGAVTFKT